MATRRKPGYPGNLTDLHRFRKTAHGHDGSSRIVMVRKTDQRTFASKRNGENPKLETITRETIETFRGQRTECKVTTEKKDCQEKVPPELVGSLTERVKTPTRKISTPKRTPTMEFQSQCLKAHNEFRQKHGVNSLKLNKEMCRLSQNHANDLVKKVVLEHSKNRDFGENIYCISSSNHNITITGDEPVKNWYKEVDKHNFGVEPSSLSSGHFTQVVWKETKELGVGFAKYMGKIVVVANYSPAGNIIGQFAENVPPIGGFCLEINGNHVDHEAKNTKTQYLDGEDRKTKLLGSIDELPSKVDAINSLTDKQVEISSNSDKPSDTDKVDASDVEKISSSTEKIISNTDKMSSSIDRMTTSFTSMTASTDKMTESFSKLTSSTISQKTFPNGTEGDFEQDFLKAHNDYRKRHGVPALKLDKRLCKLSEEWAKILASKNILEHRKNSPYGENIYCINCCDHNFTLKGQIPVDTWYEEVKNHPFGREPNNLKSGHFTQVVWKTSEFLGVGVARSRQGYIYVVANYSPAGNFVGHYTENVPALVKISRDETQDHEGDKKTNGEDKKLNSQKTNEEQDKNLPDDGKNLNGAKNLNGCDEDFDSFALEGLKVHNEYRRKHGVPLMKLNKKLYDLAKDWAEQCAKTGTMAHRPMNSYGENILCVLSSDYSHVPTARDAVKKWYEEAKEQNYGVEGVNHGTLHFTQLVWKNSTELGMALAKNQNGQCYVVANYNPRGNIVGQFSVNVLRPKP